MQNLVDGLQGVVQGGLVMEPAPVPGFLADRKTVDTPGERMDVDDNMHIVFGNGILSNILQISCLVPRIQLRAGQIDPCRIGGGNAQDTHVGLGQLIDILGGDEGGISIFERRTTLRA